MAAPWRIPRATAATEAQAVAVADGNEEALHEAVFGEAVARKEANAFDGEIAAKIEDQALVAHPDARGGPAAVAQKGGLGVLVP